MCSNGALFQVRASITVYPHHRCSDRPACPRLPFRLLVRMYGCDVACTPMIVSDSFIKSPKARDVEFTTSQGNREVVLSSEV